LNEERKSMKRNFAVILAVLAAGALFAGLVHTVLMAAHLSEPAATTVYGMTPRRLWATAVVVLALAGVVIGGLALARPAGRRGAIVALVAGLLAMVNGGLNLAIANGGPGTGNGVVGGAAALVLGLVAMALSGLALARRRSAALSLGDGCEL
jgi:hypothetical protein